MVVYGCGAHYINLIENAANSGRAGWAKGGVVEVNKYFRNHQKEAAMLKEKGGKKPQLPNDTRWMSDREAFITFVHNHSFYIEIRDEEDLPSNIEALIDNRGLLMEAKHMLTMLDKVGEALNTMQSDSSGLFDCVKAWLQLLNDEAFPDHLKTAIQTRYKKGVTDFHSLAYLVSKEPSDPDLTPEEYSKARERFSEQYPNLVLYLAGFEIEDDSLFGKTAFSSDIRRLLSPQKYWQYVRKVSQLPDAKKFCEVMESLAVCPASSAGLERVFSSFNLVHDKLRNRLGNSKVAKLVKVYGSFRNEPTSVEDNFVELEDNVE